MNQALVLILAVSDLALALGVFALVARPEATLGLFAALTGDKEALDDGRLDEASRQNLLTLARRAQTPALILLFGWSFLCGAVLTWARL